MKATLIDAQDREHVIDWYLAKTINVSKVDSSRRSSFD